MGGVCVLSPPESERQISAESVELSAERKPGSDRETQPKQALVCQHVSRGSGGVAGKNKPRANEALGEYSRQHGEQIKQTLNSAFVTWRRSFNPFHHCDLSSLLAPKIAVRTAAFEEGL